MPPMPHRRGLISESLHVVREARARSGTEFRPEAV
jgi:hypothetical protein